MTWPAHNNKEICPPAIASLLIRQNLSSALHHDLASPASYLC